MTSLCRKKAVVSGRIHPLGVGNLKNTFADFEIFQGKSCACDAVERVNQFNDIGSGRMGSDYLQRKRC